ncbi:MAG: PIN domain-containing protein [Steroidobacteraceae bacterium]|nr:PIN domain-containing protein [Deltaproteobacteria bacterium]
MNVLVDTCVWSLALRRSSPQDSPVVKELRELISEQRVVMLGPVRQEILSGIREETHFLRLMEHLRAFPDALLEQHDFESGAEFFNTCRRNGVQGSNTDFLMCAAAIRLNIPIFTTDADFLGYSRFIPLSLHTTRASCST